MNWDDTFGLYGGKASDVTKALGVEETSFVYAPLEIAKPVGKLSLKRSRSKPLEINQYQQDLYDMLHANELIGIVTEETNSRVEGVEVYRRGRTYLVRLPEAISVPVNSPSGKETQALDTIAVKVWSLEERSDSEQLARREYEALLKTDQEAIQELTTIPIALTHYPARDQIQLIKLREPIATYNDLPDLLKKRQRKSRKQRVYKEASLQAFANWGKLAAAGLFQIDILPWDHHGEMWTHDNGLDGIPGVMTGRLDGPSNLGFISRNGKEHCIVRDLEHVMSAEEILEIELPHGDPFMGDVFSARIGSTVGSIITMISRIGTLLDMKTEDVLTGATIAGYNALYGRERTQKFDFEGLLYQIQRHIDYGSMETEPLANAIDEVLVPEWVRVGFELIDGSFDASQKKEPKLAIPTQLQDYFIQAYEKEWEVGDDLMDTMVEICTEDEGNQLVPDEHIVDVIKELTSHSPKDAFDLAQKIQDEGASTIDEIMSVLKG